MPQRDHRICAYFDQDLYREIDQEATERDISKSKLVREVMDRYIRDKRLTEASREAEAQQRVEELVATATDRVEETTDAALDELIAHLHFMQLVQLRTGMHAIGTWELLKGEYEDIQATQAMQSASERLSDDAAEMGININAIGSTSRSVRSDARPQETSSQTAQRASDGGTADDTDDWSY